MTQNLDYYFEKLFHNPEVSRMTPSPFPALEGW